MNRSVISAMLVMGAVCSPGNVQSFAEDDPPVLKDVWIMSPQTCIGRPHSPTAKAAGWEFIAESKVCRATANDRPMIASVNPMEGGRFFVSVTLQMRDDATVQLFLDEIAFDLSDDGQTVCVAGGPEYFKFHVERTEDQRWSSLRIAREQGTLTVTLNGKEVLRFDDKGRSYDRVGLKPIGGTTDLHNFTLTGNLHKDRRRQDR